MDKFLLFMFLLALLYFLWSYRRAKERDASQPSEPTYPARITQQFNRAYVEGWLLVISTPQPDGQGDSHTQTIWVDSWLIYDADHGDAQSSFIRQDYPFNKIIIQDDGETGFVYSARWMQVAVRYDDV